MTFIKLYPRIQGKNASEKKRRNFDMFLLSTFTCIFFSDNFKFSPSKFLTKKVYLTIPPVPITSFFQNQREMIP